MNLIQIKQIDGLTSSLNSLATEIYDLEQEISGSFGGFDNFWDQHEWGEDYVLLKSSGSDTPLGRSNGAMILSNGHLYVDNSGVFGGLSSSGPAYLTTSVGQLYYKNIQGDNVQLKGSIAPNYNSITTPTHNASADDYILGVQTSLTSSEVYLPAVGDVSAGKEYIIKDENGNASVNNITITGVNSETIDSNLGVVVTGSRGYVSVYSNGSSWQISSERGI